MDTQDEDSFKGELFDKCDKTNNNFILKDKYILQS